MITTRDGIDADGKWGMYLLISDFSPSKELIKLNFDGLQVEFEKWTDEKGHSVFRTKSLYDNPKFQSLPSRKSQYDFIMKCVDKLTENTNAKTYCLIHGSDIEIDESKWIDSGILQEYSNENRITAIFHHTDNDNYFRCLEFRKFSKLQEVLEENFHFDKFFTKDVDLHIKSPLQEEAESISMAYLSGEKTTKQVVDWLLKHQDDKEKPETYEEFMSQFTRGLNPDREFDRVRILERMNLDTPNAREALANILLTISYLYDSSKKTNSENQNLKLS